MGLSSSLPGSREAGAGGCPRQAALLELPPAAARARVVAAYALARVHGGRPRRPRLDPRDLARDLPRPVLLGRVREGVPARQLPGRVLERRDLVVPEARDPLGIGERPPEISAEEVMPSGKPHPSLGVRPRASSRPRVGHAEIAAGAALDDK